MLSDFVQKVFDQLGIHFGVIFVVCHMSRLGELMGIDLAFSGLLLFGLYQAEKGTVKIRLLGEK